MAFTQGSIRDDGPTRKAHNEVKDLRQARTSLPKSGRFGFARHQNIKGPSKSRAGFAPTCSTRGRQLAPSL